MTGTTSPGSWRHLITITAIACGAGAILVFSIPTSRSVAAGPEAAPSSPGTEYLPSVSDMMIATIQPRHERLWRAQQNGNWQFAAYELGNLRGAFKRLGQAHPTQQNLSLPDMASSTVDRPLDLLNSAIQTRDGTAFEKAYADLTDACNSCHQALNHGVVEIRVPSRTSASDLGADSASRN